MKKTTVKSELICSECGNIFPIMRRYKSQREKYHIKDLYCYRCDKKVKFIELRDAMLIKKELEFTTDRSEFEQYLYELLCINDEEEKVKCQIKTI